MSVTGSVGEKGRNIQRDVRCVQELLNVWLEKQVRTLLRVDGIAGPKTIAAIKDFQRFNNFFVDGRIDPDAHTIQALEAQIEALSGALKMYLTLAMVLSYDTATAPQLNEPKLRAVVQSIFPLKKA